MNTMDLYYDFKKVIPRSMQLFLRRQIVMGKKAFVKNRWPIDQTARANPESWPGWPNQKKFALVFTHDVDTFKGIRGVKPLMRTEMAMGFRSAFNFVPERYDLVPELRHELTGHGFEVGVHGLKHDGKLYRSREIFGHRSQKINGYLKQWQAVGFRSPSMHHRLDWLHDLAIEYDASTFDTDPFEPQSDGVGTIFPFWVNNNRTGNGYVELPYTLAQDFTLFILMRQKNIDVWQKKLDWIASKGGMALINVHPDYMNFTGKRNELEQYPARYYEEFLYYVWKKYSGQYWHALPKEMAAYCRENVFGKKGKDN